MRRKDREISRERALAVADRCDYAVVAMTESDGSPYCVALSPARDGDTLYFHCAKSGKKTEILRKNNRVCVSFVCDVCPQAEIYSTQYSSAVMRGRAHEVLQENEKIHALRLICARYAPENTAGFDEAIRKSLDVTAIWRIDVDEVSGKQKI